MSKLMQSGILATAFLAASTIAADSQKAPWTCNQLESSTEPFYRMFPATLGSARMNDDSTLVISDREGHCFMSIKIMTSYTLNDAENDLAAKVTFDLQDSLGMCTEHLQISTAFSDYYNFYIFGGQKEIKLHFSDPWEIADIRQNGLRYFTYCADPLSLLQSAVLTTFMWTGGTGDSKYLPVLGLKPTQFQKEQNARMLQEFGGRGLTERIINLVDVDQSLMKSGDILIGRRWSGDSAEWMLLYGGFANHVAMIYEEPMLGGHPRKWVVDCPVNTSILREKECGRKTELNEWLGESLAADYEVAWLPLDKNLRAFGDLDEAALMKWINDAFGTSKYSAVQNFLSAVDTADESFPAPLNAESFPVNLRLYSEYKSNAPDNLAHKDLRVFYEAINKRIMSKLPKSKQATFGSRLHNLQDVVIYASEELHMSINDLVAMPEQDEWEYATHHGMNEFTPASYVVSALKAFGVFHGEEINAAEFTVKDVYQLDIFDSNFDMPYICQEADFVLSYCQLFGTYRLELPGYDSVHPYAHMNEKCPNSFENMLRPANC